MFEYDFNFIFSSLETAQNLYDLGDQINGLAIMTDNANHFEGLKKIQNDLNQTLEPSLFVRTWMELYPNHFSAIAVEKNVMFILLIFILIVAAFGIMSTLITMAVQKIREVGILKSIGMTPNNILTLFLVQGFVVGIIGIHIGLGLGLLILRYRNDFLLFLRERTGFELFPQEIYNFDVLPALINPHDLLIICSSALLICTMAGLFPAWYAARIQPARALRNY